MEVGASSLSPVVWTSGSCPAGLILSPTALKEDRFPTAFGKAGICCSLKEGFGFLVCGKPSLVGLEKALQV